MTRAQRQAQLYDLVETGTPAALHAIASSVNLNAPKPAGGYHGRLPLSIALACSRWSIAEFLLALGARLEARDDDGYTPLLRALATSEFLLDKDKAIAWLLDHSASALATVRGGSGDHAKASSLHLATLHGASRKAIARLVRAGAKLDARNASGLTPLHAAIVRGRHELVPMLVKLGADPDAKTRDKRDTSLHLAFRMLRYWRELDREHPAAEPQADFSVACCVEALVTAGANVNARNYLGNTPLGLGLFYGAPASILEMLIRAGADVRTIVRTKAQAPARWLDMLVAAWSRARDADELAALFDLAITRCDATTRDAMARTHGKTIEKLLARRRAKPRHVVAWLKRSTKR